MVIGALAASFSFADFLWFIGAELPPVGAVLSIVFLFLLAESLRRERLLDLYEMVGRLLVIDGARVSRWPASSTCSSPTSGASTPFT